MPAGRRSTKQALAEKQDIISPAVSLDLVKCLLRVSVFHTAWLRGLFPDDQYNSRKMKGLDGMEVQMLNTTGNEQARRLVEWVEFGVNDALEKKYLKTLLFGYSSDPLGTRLLEEFVYTFNYDADAITFSSNGKEFPTPQASQADVHLVKGQILRLMRMLVQLCRTLEPVPEERYLFMKLLYNDSTPDDYQPPFFKELGDEQVSATFRRRPFTMQVGTVNTNHHAVGLKVKSVLDALDDDDQDDEQEPEMQNSNVQQSASATHDDNGIFDAQAGACLPSICEEDGPAQSQSKPEHARPREERGPGPSEQNAVMMDLEAAPKQQQALTGPIEPAANTANAAPVMENASPPQQQMSCQDSDATCASQTSCTEAIRQYCSKRTKVEFTAALGEFVNVSTDDLRRCFARLVEQGFLANTICQDVYHVIATNLESAKPRLDLPAAAIADKLGELNVGLSGPERPQRGQSKALAKPSLPQERSCFPSSVAVQHEQNAGSLQTSFHSRNAGNIQKPMDASNIFMPDTQPPMVFPESQESMGMGRKKKRKASVAENPIHQNMKIKSGRKTRMSSRLQQMHS